MKKTLLAVMALVSLCGYAQLQVEGFEGSWPPEGWTIHNNGIGTASSWQQSDGSLSQPAYSGNYAAYLDKENVSNGTFAQDWLTTPSMIVGENMVLSFFSRLTLNGDQGSIYKLLLLPDGGDADNLSDYIALEEWTELEINPVQTDYNEMTVNIPSSYIGQSVRFAFFMQGDDYDRWLIDNVKLYSVCSAPFNLIATNITAASADLSWTEAGNASSWEIEVIHATDVPSGQGNIYSGELPYTVTQTTSGEVLTAGGYKYYVRTLCPDGAYSEWVGPLYFSTDITLNNAIHGVVKADINGDGICNDDDVTVPYAQITVSIDGESAYTIYADYNGAYTIYGLPDGEYALDLQVMETDIFPVIPVMTENVVFDLETNDLTVTHCLPEPEPVTDLGVLIFANNNAVPGFNANYNFYVNNFGSQDVSDVAITLNFDSSRLDYVSTTSGYPVTVSGSTITVTMGEIGIYDSKSGTIKFHVKEPPVNTGGEQLVFTASLSEVENDIDMSNNTSVFHAVITNSFDPNDITVHEGAEITEDQTDDYLTYTIRFQNTGNGNAINIKLENTLDELLDWNTFEPLASSHNNTVKRTEGRVRVLF